MQYFWIGDGLLQGTEKVEEKGRGRAHALVLFTVVFVYIEETWIYAYAPMNLMMTDPQLKTLHQ